VETISPTVVTIALAAATIAKILVDLVRGTQKLPPWASPLLALAFSILAAFLLQLAGGGALTVQAAAINTLAGILAAGTAVGATELQKRTNQPTYLTVEGFADAVDTLTIATPAAPTSEAK
jgi:uncharacterized membrane protein YjjP (DUF1212 family)